MTRRIVYGISLWLFLGSAACTIAAIALPNWVSYTAPTDIDPIRVTYGLHKRCSSITGTCTSFPTDDDCRSDDGKSFCAMWRSTGFAMNFAVIMELACLVAYITVLVGGRQARESGWKMVAGLLTVVGVGQCVAMALVAYLYEHDSRFFIGWELDKSFVLCSVSWTALIVNAVAVVGAALFLQPEDDYEPIPDPR